MSDDFDDFARELQDQIYEETRRTYGQVAFERWLEPRYVGSMDNPDGYGRVTGSCGDTMEIFLKFEDDGVAGATFQTNGCGASSVCGSFAAELAHGKSPDEVAEITGETILEILGGLPEQDQHCAFLAAETLQEALGDYMIKQRQATQKAVNSQPDTARVRERMAEEERVQERIDEKGIRWKKVYFGGGAHFRNWLEQCKELGEVTVEEVDSTGFKCFEEGGEKLYRIWLKVDSTKEDDLF
jgi:nitrogen fixation NifU-like protein